MGVVGHLVAVDPGRHRLFVATTETDLCALGDGLVLRWLDGHARRFGERIIDFAGIDQAKAVATTAAVAAIVVEDLTDQAGRDHPIKLAIPASFGPACRQAVLDGFDAAGIRLDPTDLVERPIAAAAGWLAHRAATTGRMPTDPVLVIDDDGGEISIAALDPSTKRILFVRPLSTGPCDDPTAVTERLRDAVATTARLAHRGELVRETDWATLTASIGDVVITGCSANDPMLTRLITTVLPAAHPMPDPVVARDRAVTAGLNHLDQFDDWVACWPTLPLVMAGETILPIGPATAAGRDVRPPAMSGATLTFGGTASRGIRIPQPFTSATIRALDDGRILVLDDADSRPLAIQVAWPCPGRSTKTVAVRSVGRRAIEFVSGPESVDHVEPELGCQPERVDVDPFVVAVEAAEKLTKVDLGAQ